MTPDTDLSCETPRNPTPERTARLVEKPDERRCCREAVFLPIECVDCPRLEAK